VDRSLILCDLFAIAQQPETIPWISFRDGVEIHWLYEADGAGPAAALMRFKPGAKIAMHEHTGFEHILVLSGSQTDQNSQIKRGGLMIHAPGTRHEILSEEGCIVLAIYEKRVSFVGEE